MLIKLIRHAESSAKKALWVNPDRISIATINTDGSTTIIVDKSYYSVQESPEDINRLERDGYSMPDFLGLIKKEELTTPAPATYVHLIGIAQNEFGYLTYKFLPGQTYNFEEFGMNHEIFKSLVTSGTVVPVEE